MLGWNQQLSCQTIKATRLLFCHEQKYPLNGKKLFIYNLLFSIFIQVCWFSKPRFSSNHLPRAGLLLAANGAREPEEAPGLQSSTFSLAFAKLLEFPPGLPEWTRSGCAVWGISGLPHVFWGGAPHPPYRDRALIPKAARLHPLSKVNSPRNPFWSALPTTRS